MAVVKPHNQLLEEPPRIVLLQANTGHWCSARSWTDTALLGQGESANKTPRLQTAAGLDKLEHVAARRKFHDNCQVVLGEENLLELDDTASRRSVVRATAVLSGLLLDSAQPEYKTVRASNDRQQRECTVTKKQPFPWRAEMHVASISKVGKRTVAATTPDTNCSQ